MNKNAFLIITVIIAAFCLLLYFTIKDDLGKRKYNWTTTFDDGDKQPYDFGVLKKLLQHKNTGKFEVVNDQLKDKLQTLDSTEQVSYFFIGRYCFYTREELNTLLNFVARGGKAMLIAESYPDTLMTALQEYGKPFKVDELYAPGVDISLEAEDAGIRNLHYNYRFFNEEMDHPINWNYLSEEGQLDYYYGSTSSRYLRLGSVTDKLNYAKFKLGNGYIYLHTNPVLFTNYYMADDSGFAYVSRVFSELDAKKMIYDAGSRNFKEDAAHTLRQSDTPLSYILKQPALKWAWYLLCIAIVCFFLFMAKREQRIINVLEQKRNTSLNFVQTISGLYFNYNDHKKMAQIKMHLFTGFIRQKLGIPTNDITPEVLQQIATKAKVPLQDTEIIFYYYNSHINDRNDVSADDLINLNRYIETFYQYYNSKQSLKKS